MLDFNWNLSYALVSSLENFICLNIVTVVIAYDSVVDAGAAIDVFITIALSLSSKVEINVESYSCHIEAFNNDQLDYSILKRLNTRVYAAVAKDGEWSPPP